MIGFGRYNNLGIGLSIYLRDNFSPQARQVSANMAALNMQANRLMRQQGDRLLEFGAILGGLSVGYFSFFKGSLGILAEFEKEMATLKIVTDDNTVAMGKLQRKIEDVGVTGIFSITEVAKAATVLGKMGFTRKQIYQSIEAASDLATAGDMQIVQASEAIGQVLNTFDLPARQSAYIADLLSVAANKSAASVDNLLESLQYSGDVLKTLNIPLEDTLSMFMVLANAGIRGSSAGTYVANMYRYISMASGLFKTGRQKQAMEMMGLTREDFMEKDSMGRLTGNLKKPMELMEKFRENLKMMAPVDRAAIIQAMTNIRGAKALQKLTAELTYGGDLKQFNEMLKDPSIRGSAKKIRDEIMNTIWGDLEQLRESWGQFRKDFANIPGLRVVVKSLTWIVNAMSNMAKTNLGKVLLPLVALGLGVAAAVGAISLALGLVIRSLAMASMSFGNFSRAGVAANLAVATSARAAGAAQAGAGMGRGAAMMGGMPWWAFTGALGWNAGARGGRFTNARGGFVSAAVAQRYMAIYGNKLGPGKFLFQGSGTIGRLFAGLAGILPKVIKWFGLLGAAIGPIIDLVQGNTGAGIGGLLGTAIGFAIAGPLGAVIGSLLGGGIGSMFHKKEKEDVYTDNASGKTATRLSAEEFMKAFMNNMGKANGDTTIILQVDGQQAMRKTYKELEKENVFKANLFK